MPAWPVAAIGCSLHGDEGVRDSSLLLSVWQHLALCIIARPRSSVRKFFRDADRPMMRPLVNQLHPGSLEL